MAIIKYNPTQRNTYENLPIGNYFGVIHSAEVVEDRFNAGRVQLQVDYTALGMRKGEKRGTVRAWYSIPEVDPETGEAFLSEKGYLFRMLVATGVLREGVDLDLDEKVLPSLVLWKHATINVFHKKSGEGENAKVNARVKMETLTTDQEDLDIVQAYIDGLGDTGKSADVATDTASTPTTSGTNVLG